MVLWAGLMRGPRAVPGQYHARLVAGEDSMEVAFEILADPRSSSTQSELVEQFEFLKEVRDDLSEVHQEIERLREVRAQLKDLASRLEARGEAPEVQEAAKALGDTLSSVEQALYQTKNRSSQDPLNYPIRLNNKLAALAGVASMGEFQPTKQMVEVRRELMRQIEEELEKLRAIYAKELDEFNALVRESRIPAVLVPPTED
jgi:small-conductance mechanosensitive channel